MTTKNTQLHHIIYMSQLCAPAGQQIQDVLKVALRNNPLHTITGMMLCSQGNVLQVLEGTQEQVETLFERIERDPRHKSVYVVVNEPLKSRHFPDWSMGYRVIDEDSIGTFQHYEQVFRTTPQTIHHRIRTGVAIEIIHAFCKWAMD